MGPILIFDKSALQCLNLDEAVWLDNFFLCNITPIFFIETLADLEKQVRKGRTPEDVVGSLAFKTPDMGSKANAHHSTLLEGELLGLGKLDMEHGIPHLIDGKTLALDGKTGVIFRPAAEEEALQRWQDHEFVELERLQAKAWRKALSNVDLDDNYRYFKKFFPIGRPKTFKDVKRLVDFYIDDPDPRSVLTFGLSLIGVPLEAQGEVVERWVRDGRRPLKEFAPYFVHVFSVDLFFYLAIAADLIGRERPSHKVDLAYLYYLPFCMVFTSNDKLHADIVPFFLRPNQTFVPGTDLKADLSRLDKHYDTFPDETKKRGLMSFASYPPEERTFLITQLWDKHMSPHWREHKSKAKPELDSEASRRLLERMKRFREDGTPVSIDDKRDSGKIDQMVIERKVYGRKGKWCRLPPEVLNRRQNEKGEWESISDSE